MADYDTKKLPSRDWLVNAYRQRIQDANEMLADLSDSEYNMLRERFGGLLSDENVATKQGYFRSTASKLNKQELDRMITLLDSFIENAEYVFEEAKKIDDFAHRLGVSPEDLSKIYTFMDYAKNRVTEEELSSHQIRDIAIARVKDGQSFMEIVRAFDRAIANSSQDPDLWFTLFSENGRLMTY